VAHLRLFVVSRIVSIVVVFGFKRYLRSLVRAANVC
jgi:hypothetical protein